MKIAYFDCFSGISGDMVLGALVDAGLDIEKLKSELSSLNVHEYELSFEKTVKRGITATFAKVDLHHTEHSRHLSEIEDIIEKSQISSIAKSNALKIFRKLAQAEAKVHGVTVDEVHFHEVGAVDAIIDIVGACIGLELLGIEEVYGSAIPYAKGYIEAEHGRMPNPAPATAELLAGAPTYGVDTELEIVTPTGAAILTGLSKTLGKLPPMSIEKIGYGAGWFDLPLSNVLRLVIGEKSGSEIIGEDIVQVETNMDDLNPQIYETVIEKLFEAGAVDVFLTPVQMKKSRPGTLLTVLCRYEDLAKITDTIFQESSTLGVRVAERKRICLKRQWETISTRYGDIRIKIGREGDCIKNFAPEYEDCKAAAATHGVPVKVVHDEAIASYLKR